MDTDSKTPSPRRPSPLKGWKPRGTHLYIGAIALLALLALGGHLMSSPSGKPVAGSSDLTEITCEVTSTLASEYQVSVSPYTGSRWGRGHTAPIYRVYTADCGDLVVRGTTDPAQDLALFEAIEPGRYVFTVAEGIQITTAWKIG